MQFLDYNENKQRGTYDFPFEFYHIDQNHPQYIMSYHWHIEYEIIRIIRGEFHITMDERKIIAKEGDILFINGGTLHAGIPYACVYECIVFDMNAFLKHNPSCKKLIQNIIDHSVLIYHHFTKKQPDVHNILWDVFDSMRYRPLGYELTVFGQLYHFFGIVYSQKYYLKDAPQTRRDYKRIMQLKNVLELIENAYASPLTLEDLAKAADMSSKYFCKFFLEMTHKRPMDYLNYHRIEHACYQLASTEDSVTDIALNCGFNDLSYFIKTFKKYKGVTPGKYLK
ncbi:MAG: AraC family transcriptional regulator [Lachnospiraceae bacterium]|nr:AraC family transcriptional regulator [Lachnospiraceae bacterium]